MPLFGNFINKAKAFVKETWDKSKKFAQAVVKDFSEIILNNRKPHNSVNGVNNWGGSNRGFTEEGRIARIESMNRELEIWHGSILVGIEKREKDIQKAYDRYYKDILIALDQCDIVTTDIRVHISKMKKTFNHVLRDEVNKRVSSEYWEWKELKENPKTTSRTVQEYTSRVYDEADNMLLEKLRDACEETNEYIEKCVDKFLKDKERALQIKKESLINLTKDKDSKMKELQKIMEEYASMAFIQYEAEKEI